MNFQQRDAGDFRIYAMAFDSPQGGYVAGVEVRTIGSTSIPARVLYSNEFLANGFRFEASADALKHALDIGHRLIRQGLGTTATPGPTPRGDSVDERDRHAPERTEISHHRIADRDVKRLHARAGGHDVAGPQTFAPAR